MKGKIDFDEVGKKWVFNEGGLVGSRYDRTLGGKDIAKKIRDYVKKAYPGWKFSVVAGMSTYTPTITVAVMEAPYDIFDRARIRKAAENRVRNRFYKEEEFEDDVRKTEGCFLKDAYETGHCSTWDFWSRNSRHSTWLNDSAQAVLDDVYETAMSYNFDDSDITTDYFSTNFYPSFDIGKRDRPFRIRQQKGGAA
jgi:hypothetical protein